jgi:galactokinase
MSLESMAERTEALFTRCFGHEPSWVVAAPGRVNLIGEHTDYNDGFVLPMAIERYTVIAGDRSPNREVTLHSVTTGETATFSARPPIEKGEPAWSNYVRGVIAGFQKRGSKIGGFNAVIESNVPYGGGVSSSAALEVAAATFLEAMTGQHLDPIGKALLCQQAEHKFAGVPCGIMDQFTSVLARENQALLLDCRSRTTTPVLISDPGIVVMIINTNVRHKLVESAYSQRRAQCENAARALKVSALRDATIERLQAAQGEIEPIVLRRARHVITENERTLKTVHAIEAADWAAVGELMYASHASLRDDYEVSCRELDAVVEIAQELGPAGGMIGCRMTGAGFGGCAVSLVRAEALKHITKKVDEMYERKTGHQATVFSSRPAGGAKVLRSGAGSKKL